MNISKRRLLASVLSGLGAGVAAAQAAGVPLTVKGYFPFLLGALFLALGNFFAKSEKPDPTDQGTAAG